MARQEKDMARIRETTDFRKVIHHRRADLKDYGFQHRVEINWNLNPEAIRDRMFKLVIDGDIEIILDLEEFLSYTRAV